MQKKSILFTRPSHDQATACLYYFSEKLIEEIKEVGEYIIINLEKYKATREIFEKSIIESKPRLVVLNGHGFKHAVCGQNKEIILDDNNVDLLDSKIVYMVVIEPSRSSIPSKDKNLKVFIKPYVTLVLSLLSGLTVEKAINNTKETLRGLIREYGVYGVRDKFGDAPLIRFALYWDLTFLKGYGDLSSIV